MGLVPVAWIQGYFVESLLTGKRSLPTSVRIGNVPEEIVELCTGCDLRATVSEAYQPELAHLG